MEAGPKEAEVLLEKLISGQKATMPSSRQMHLFKYLVSEIKPKMPGKNEEKSLK